MQHLLSITSAEYIGGYKILALFNNGIKKIIDFDPIVKEGKGVCKKMKDLNYFKSFTLDPFTIDWNNEIGFAPEYLYKVGVNV